MEKRYFTIGMAGHIDHGKTTLTKALTNVDTDRLKEEKERQISIELGFAPLHINDDMQVSVVDVPGHERFIRQMIAGVAGIDLVILVVAADEGVMPQTREHLEILSFLGIDKGIIAVSKIDRVDPDFVELVEDDIKEQLEGTVFQEAPIILVDSLSNKGIDELKTKIEEQLNVIEKQKTIGSFRLPIDQVFTVKGQGTVVRGTIYEGEVEVDRMLTVLPKNIEVKARQLQVHHHQVTNASAGQRVAINLGGITKSEIKRGDVLVSSNDYIVTQTIDIALRFVNPLKYSIRQRSLVKCHIGTTEVMGKLVFFDRNDVVNEDEEILCQLRLDEEIVTKRGDRFIVRRPTPAETIGGGWVIDPGGEKYRFGHETIKMLKDKQEGTPEDRIRRSIDLSQLMSVSQLSKETGINHDLIEEILVDQDFVQVKQGLYTTRSIINHLGDLIVKSVSEFHQLNPLINGMNKAELTQMLMQKYKKELIDYLIDHLIKEGELKRTDQFLAVASFEPTFPAQWAKRMEGVLIAIKQDGMKVQTWGEYVSQAGLPVKEANDLLHYLIGSNQIYQLDEKHYIHKEPLILSISQLKAEKPDQFELKDAKDILGLSRKYLVPLVELYDKLNMTKRIDNIRVWEKNDL
ncbi:selenocysteine-specific translation elongation factor [Bacillus sp. PS06]|uniref:selenocysteine-specific translation elongation factor n=1 Tax=Bacillus sp. PS06 TaxID=2764176 RepID=UPI00177E327D|nr:selenocysteine-specific translation elongation factor [Bacillus sp. PS06]MBD8068189.1 selenocysteine-specific translation elongation factor [Bacillus sp. PS06]